jgi:hypothetical protein
LKHTFDNNYGGRNSKERTDNLMDYSQGTELGAFQWNVMSNVAVINRFDKDEEGQQQRIEDSRWIAQMIENIRCNRQNNNNNMSVAGMESSRRNTPALNNPSFNDGVNYAGAAIWVREVIGDNVDISNIRIESENRIIIGARPNAITLEITTPHGSRAHSAVELTGFLHQYLTADRSTFEQQLQRAISGIFASNVNVETMLPRADNLHQCVLPALNNEQRMMLLSEINKPTNQSYHLLAVRIMSNIPQEQTNNMFVRLAESDLFGALKRQMNPRVYGNFVEASFRAFLQQTDIGERLHNVPTERRFEWNQGSRNFISYTLSIEGNSLNIFGARALVMGVPDYQFRAQVNIADLLAIQMNTSLNTNLGTIPGDGRFYPIPAFYFDWLATNYDREQTIAGIDFAINFIPLGATVSQLRNIVRAGRYIYAVYLATGVAINIYNFAEISVGLNTYLEELSKTNDNVANFLVGINFLDRYYPLSELVVSRIATGQNIQLFTDFTVAWSLSKYIIRDELGIVSPQTVDEIMNTLQNFVDDINVELSKY